MLIWKRVVITHCNKDGGTIEDHLLWLVAPHRKPAHFYKKILAQLIKYEYITNMML